MKLYDVGEGMEVIRQIENEKMCVTEREREREREREANVERR